MKRDIIIGDVHGCALELEGLLQKVNFSPTDDQIYFTGDLINRGPDSLEVLKIMYKNSARGVLGNHEMHFLEYLRFPDIIHKKLWMSGLKRELTDHFIEGIPWMTSLPYYLETDNFIIVHAGLSPLTSLQKTSPQILCTIRTWDGIGKNLKDLANPPWHEFYKEDKLIIYGHWASQGILEKENSICMDSGCVYGGHLSALLLPERKIIQYKAKKAYSPLT